MTNFDKELQEMTIDDLAKYKACFYDCYICPIANFCDKWAKETEEGYDCYGAWKSWLNRETFAMTDEQALEKICKIEGIDNPTGKALQIAKSCLADQVRIAKSDRETFKGKCPYTDKECDEFHCWRCDVEKDEEGWLNSEVKNSDDYS